MTIVLVDDGDISLIRSVHLAKAIRRERAASTATQNHYPVHGTPIGQPRAIVVRPPKLNISLLSLRQSSSNRVLSR
jgi:hypothetical protein